MKEILSFYIGQAGVQTGSSVWELFCAEHNLTYDGVLIDKNSQYECLEAFFQETSTHSWVPRTLFVDLEPTVIDEVRSGTFKRLFHPDRLLSGPEDAANNFSRGFFTVGKLLLGPIRTEFRHLIEQCDMAQGILLMRSLGGGTGAGLTSAIFEVFEDHPKTPKIEIPIYPSPTLSTSMVEPYNCLLGEHFCMEDIDVGLLLDNEAMFDICSKYLAISYPTYNTINRLIAQIVSSITASVRFENVLNCDLTVLQTNMVPYPRIHFPLCNFAPIMNQERANHQELSVQELTRLVFERDNQMMKVDHFYGKFMSCALFYRGNVCPHHVYLALSEIKRTRTIEFVDWCPTGFKVGINAVCPVIVPESKFAESKKNVAMLTNTSAIGQAWQRLTHRFYLLYSKRSFVHWFVGEGMEECEFTEALYNISALVKDYEEAGENTRTKDSVDNLSPKAKVGMKETLSGGILSAEDVELNVNENAASNYVNRGNWGTTKQIDEIERVHQRVFKKEMNMRQPLQNSGLVNRPKSQSFKRGKGSNTSCYKRHRYNVVSKNASSSNVNFGSRPNTMSPTSSSLKFSSALKYLELTDGCKYLKNTNTNSTNNVVSKFSRISPKSHDVNNYLHESLSSKELFIDNENKKNHSQSFDNQSSTLRDANFNFQKDSFSNLHYKSAKNVDDYLTNTESRCQPDLSSIFLTNKLSSVGKSPSTQLSNYGPESRFKLSNFSSNNACNMYANDDLFITNQQRLPLETLPLKNDVTYCSKIDVVLKHNFDLDDSRNVYPKISNPSSHTSHWSLKSDKTTLISTLSKYSKDYRNPSCLHAAINSTVINACGECISLQGSDTNFEIVNTTDFIPCNRLSLLLHSSIDKSPNSISVSVPIKLIPIVEYTEFLQTKRSNINSKSAVTHKKQKIGNQSQTDEYSSIHNPENCLPLKRYTSIYSMSICDKPSCARSIQFEPHS